MKRIPGLRALFRLPTTTARVADEVSDEVAFHLEMQARDLEAQGLSPEAACAEAQRRFGDVQAAESELGDIDRRRVRRAWRAEWWEALAQDLRYAARGLRATPLVTAIAILSLALGIGANTAMFSIVDALVLRALPVPHAERLTLLASDETRYGSWWSNPTWEAIRDRPQLHDGAFAFCAVPFDLAERGVADPVDGLQVSGSMFEVLGVRAVLGRTFTEADDRRGGPADGPVAVISHGFWQRRFGGAGDVIGRTITLDRIQFTIIGVTPASFNGPEVGRTFDVAVPLASATLLTGGQGRLDDRGSSWLHVLLRRAPGQTIEQATARLHAVQRSIADETRPTNMRAEDAAKYLAQPLMLIPAPAGSSELRMDFQRPAFALMGIVALTLLIACGNIANLLLARAAARRHELSVRTALGASGARLARQLFVESLLLSVVGAALGVVFAVWGSRLIVAQLSTSTNNVFLDVGLDWRVLAFTGAVAIGTALLFGTIPARRAARVAPTEAMKAQGRGTSSERGVGLAGALVMAQVALSLVLLVGAGLLGRSFASLATRELGFERDRALLVNVGTQRARLDSSAQAALYPSILETARTLPGVSHAAVSMITPISGHLSHRRMDFPARPDLTALPDMERTIAMNVVSPGWFGALGIPLVAGRDFHMSDRPGAPRAVIVNRAFVARYLGTGSPIGQQIRESPDVGADLSPLEIVGVVGDAAYRTLREPPRPTMYWALPQTSQLPPDLSLIVRAAAGSPGALSKGVTEAILGANRDLTLVVRPLAVQVNAALIQERLIATLSVFFGVLALLLAALGLYGVTSCAVTRRRIELGIRMALGSTPTQVVRLVLARVALLVGGGVVIGAAIGWGATRYIESLLFGLTPRDPVTLLGAVAILAGIGVFAGWLPAARAARIDPARVLRDG